MLLTIIVILMSLSFLAPIVLLIVYFHKAEKIREKHDKEWRELYHEMKDDPKALRFYHALSLLR